MRSRRNNEANTRGCSNSQQAEDVIKTGFNQANNAQVPGNARKRVRGPTFMPKVWTKIEKGRISVQFNEYGQPVDKTTSTLTHHRIACKEWKVIASFTNNGIKLRMPRNKFF